MGLLTSQSHNKLVCVYYYREKVFCIEVCVFGVNFIHVTYKPCEAEVSEVHFRPQIKQYKQCITRSIEINWLITNQL